eukprot:TRINITY_DN1364_c0_g1_i1.p1 TRINITY_DN1364_c0_g1~~TRINITY_DN1364_c0_g1_i1.p1  ORF type:complete len:620 (+),score=193.95 TRINITY_DN1364_c0_g1_i1:216-2075(+)
MSHGLERAEKQASGHARTMPMWCNQKLMEAGENYSFSRDDRVAHEFSSGVNVARMLRILSTGRRMGEAKDQNLSTDGIMHQVDKELGSIKETGGDDNMLALYRQTNLRACWNFMQNHEGIKLGGVNPQSVQGEHLGTVLALIFRWVRKYDLVDGYGPLLEWVKSKTGTYIEVQGFSSSMNNGIAFLEMYSNLCPEHFNECAGTVDDWMERSQEDRLQMAFQMIEEGPLGVSQMLLVQDLEADRLDKDHKEQLITYVSAIKSAHKKWWEDEELRRKTQTNESQTALNEGDRYYKMGLQKFGNGRDTSDEVITTILTETVASIQTDPEPDYDRYIELALDRFDQETTVFNEAKDNFVRASDEYKKVNHVDVTDKIHQCDEQDRNVDEYRDMKKKELEELLRQEFQNDRAYRIYLKGDDLMSITIEEASEFVQTVVEETTNKMKASHRPEERVRLQEEALKQADEWVVKFEPIRDLFIESEETYPDSSVEGKRMCRTKIDELDNMISDFYENMRIEIANIEVDDTQDVLLEDELLKLYHETTRNIDKQLVGQEDLDTLTLDQLTQDPRVTKNRLNKILSKVRGVWGDSDNLRQKVHDRIDAIFNAHGYDCKKGTDCCVDCKA